MPGDFQFRDLTDETRQLMVEEIEADVAEELLYPSQCFNSHGHTIYPALLLEAARQHDESWLAVELGSQGAFDFGGKYVTTSGKEATVPKNAHTRLAQSEFNRFYVRALCIRAIGIPGSALVIYRARESSFPRQESEDKIGEAIDPNATLDDLRKSIGASPFFGMPEVLSGLSVTLDANRSS